MDRDEELNEISDYYKNKPDQDTDIEKADGAETDSAEVSESAMENNDAEESAENEESSKDKKRELLWFRGSVIAAAAAVIALGFLTGRFIVPVSRDAVIEKTATLFKTDSDYLAAVKDNKEINTEIDELNADNERIENSFNDVVEYEKQLDKLKAEFKSVNDKLYDARSELKAVKSDYDSAQSSLKKLKSKTITLSPGTYTAGVHIPAGTYTATGNGSLLTAGTDKNLKINVNLDREPYRCELSERDTIKLSCEAEFKPEVEE